MTTPLECTKQKKGHSLLPSDDLRQLGGLLLGQSRQDLLDGVAWNGLSELPHDLFELGVGLDVGRKERDQRRELH